MNWVVRLVVTDVAAGGGGATRPIPMGHGGTPWRPNNRAMPQKSGPKVKNGRSSAKDGTPESQDSSQRMRRGRASFSNETKGIWHERELWERFDLQKE